MSDHFQNNSVTTSEEEEAQVTLLRDLLQTRMLPGENANLFKRLCARVITETQPRDVFEELLVLDYLHYVWEALRLRRYKENLLQVRAVGGLEAHRLAERSGTGLKIVPSESPVMSRSTPPQRLLPRASSSGSSTRTGVV